MRLLKSSRPKNYKRLKLAVACMFVQSYLERLIYGPRIFIMYFTINDILIEVIIIISSFNTDIAYAYSMTCSQLCLMQRHNNLMSTWKCGETNFNRLLSSLSLFTLCFYRNKFFALTIGHDLL